MSDVYEMIIAIFYATINIAGIVANLFLAYKNNQNSKELLKQEAYNQIETEKHRRVYSEKFDAATKTQLLLFYNYNNAAMLYPLIFWALPDVKKQQNIMLEKYKKAKDEFDEMVKVIHARNALLFPKSIMDNLVSFETEMRELIGVYPDIIREYRQKNCDKTINSKKQIEYHERAIKLYTSYEKIYEQLRDDLKIEESETEKR